MSRAYQIRLAHSENRHICVEDGVQTSLELLDVLPADSMSELLAKELENRGFVREGDKAVRREDDGTQVVVDLQKGTVTARLSAEDDVSVELERTVRTYEERRKEAAAQLRESLEKEAETEIAQRTERLREKVTEKLEARLRDLQQELDGITNRVMVEALKTRAAQLGEIEEISEDGESGALTIRVRT